MALHYGGYETKIKPSGIISCSQPLEYIYGIDQGDNCCISGTQCGKEIGCFEGGLYADTGIWRSSSASVLRNPYSGKLSGDEFVNPWHQKIIEKVLLKGPSIIKWNGLWEESLNGC